MKRASFFRKKEILLTFSFYLQIFRQKQPERNLRRGILELAEPNLPVSKSLTALFGRFVIINILMLLFSSNSIFTGT